MSEPTSCCRARGGYCERCDVLVGLDGLHVIGVERDDGGAAGRHGGVRADGHGVPGLRGRRARPRPGRGGLVDAPAMGRPVRIRWRKRRWVCPDPGCPVGTFVEQDERIAAPRSSLTTRACRWAIEQIRREHASVNGIRRQLGTGWRTVWESIEPLLQAMAADPARFEGVAILGVDEHVWHHVSTKPIEDGGRGPKELTGMVDLTRDEHGRTRARLLDLVPGRSGQAYKTGSPSAARCSGPGSQIATLDPFRGYKNAIDDQLDDARAVLDAFHVVKLATAGRRRGPPPGPAGHPRPPRPQGRPAVPDPQHPARRRREPHRPATEPAGPRRGPPTSATSRSSRLACAQQVRSAYHQDSHAAGRKPSREDPRPRSPRARSPRSPASAAP
jgi:transposase